MSDASSRLNAALEGRYVIERELGEGGMATWMATVESGMIAAGLPRLQF